MPDSESPEDEFEEASARLSESLENCRSVVNDYRMLLSGEHRGRDQASSDEQDTES